MHNSLKETAPPTTYAAYTGCALHEGAIHSTKTPYTSKLQHFSSRSSKALCCNKISMVFQQVESILEIVPYSHLQKDAL